MRTITGLFDSRPEAERAVEPWSRNTASTGPGAGPCRRPGQRRRRHRERRAARRHHGFGGYASLPAQDHASYEEGLRRGGILVSAEVPDETAQKVSASLEQPAPWTSTRARRHGAKVAGRVPRRAPRRTASRVARVSSGRRLSAGGRPAAAPRPTACRRRTPTRRRRTGGGGPGRGRRPRRRRLESRLDLCRATGSASHGTERTSCAGEAGVAGSPAVRPAGSGNRPRPADAAPPGRERRRATAGAATRPAAPRARRPGNWHRRPT